MKQLSSTLFFSLFTLTLMFTSCKKEEIEPKDDGLFVETKEVFDGDSPLEWTELDLSEVVGENYAQVTLRLTNYHDSFTVCVFRQKGDGFDYNPIAGNVNSLNVAGYAKGQAIIYTDEFGRIEWKSVYSRAVSLEVVAYIK